MRKTIDIKYRPQAWLGIWIDLATVLVNVIIIPFGFHVAWGFDYSFYLLKRDGRKQAQKKG